MIDTTAVIQSVVVSLPEIALLFVACLLLMLDLLLERSDRNHGSQQRNTELIAYLTVLGIVIAAGISWWSGSSSYSAYNGMFIVDNYALFFKYLFYITTILIVLMSIHYLEIEHANLSEYYVFVLFALCGMMVMVSGTDLLSIYVGLELMALSIYVLSGFTLHEIRSNEAALKYIILGALSSSILLYGISLFYGLTGTTQLEELSRVLLGLVSQEADPALVLATIFLLAGFCFKVAVVPFHMWLPDVYEGAPTSITAFMSIGPKVASFAVMVRVFLDTLASQVDIWVNLLTVAAVLTVVTGSLVALVQTNIKRMLAYSSIAHAGFALMGVVAAGVFVAEGGTTNNSDALSAVMFYLVVYSFMNLGAFAIIIASHSKGQSAELINDYGGLSKSHPWLALLMMIFMFSLAGIPPTAGFFAKFYIIVSLIEQNLIALAIFSVIFSVVSAYYYIRIVMLMFMKIPAREMTIKLHANSAVVFAITIVATLGLGIFPAWAISFIQSAIL